MNLLVLGNDFNVPITFNSFNMVSRAGRVPKSLDTHVDVVINSSNVCSSRNEFRPCYFHSRDTGEVWARRDNELLKYWECKNEMGRFTGKRLFQELIRITFEQHDSYRDLNYDQLFVTDVLFLPVPYSTLSSSSSHCFTNLNNISIFIIFHGLTGIFIFYQNQHCDLSRTEYYQRQNTPKW